eukprot:Amastigsp_a210706_2.p5 type:complete len:110 gc:universal Amastigsp_a210706_2:35-364(+)
MWVRRSSSPSGSRFRFPWLTTSWPHTAQSPAADVTMVPSGFLACGRNPWHLHCEHGTCGATCRIFSAIGSLRIPSRCARYCAFRAAISCSLSCGGPPPGGALMSCQAEK